MTDAPPPIGHNLPPSELDQPDINTWLDPLAMRDQLELDYADHLRRRDELLAGVDRFFERVKRIEDEDKNARATDFVAQIKLLHTDVEADRERHARPLTTAHRVVQKFFKEETLEPLTKAVGDIQVKMTFYARAKAAEARAKLERERREAQAKADAAAAAAEASLRPSQLEDAARAAKEAEKATRKLETATTASLGRGRGDSGAVATLRDNWDFEVVDLALVPREFLTLDVARVKAAIAAGARDSDGAPAIPGLKIVNNTRVQVRA